MCEVSPSKAVQATAVQAAMLAQLEARLDDLHIEFHHAIGVLSLIRYQISECQPIPDALRLHLEYASEACLKLLQQSTDKLDVLPKELIGAWQPGL